MNTAKSVTTLALMLGLCAAAGAAEMHMSTMKASPGFDQLKALAGNWQAQTPDGKDVKASYQLVSGGNCVMETLDTPDGANMITMYHMDGSRLVMDHYCATNNVPHMRATSSADGKKLDFAFVTASNLAKPGDMHMHTLKVAIEDSDHFTQEWSMHDHGKVQPVVFHFHRAG